VAIEVAVATGQAQHPAAPQPPYLAPNQLLTQPLPAADTTDVAAGRALLQTFGLSSQTAALERKGLCSARALRSLKGLASDKLVREKRNKGACVRARRDEKRPK
jgi:hypothetical protein